jgi:hypothetical protein
MYGSTYIVTKASMLCGRTLRPWLALTCRRDPPSCWKGGPLFEGLVSHDALSEELSYVIRSVRFGCRSVQKCAKQVHGRARQQYYRARLMELVLSGQGR